MEERARTRRLQALLRSTATFEVLVRTADVKGAGTDARVYLRLLPEKPCEVVFQTPSAPASAQAAPVWVHPSSGAQRRNDGADDGSDPFLARVESLVSCDATGCEVQLVHPESTAKPFERGALDSFTVTMHRSGTMPARLQIWHDNSGRRPDWLLADVCLRLQGTEEWTLFPCNR